MHWFTSDLHFGHKNIIKYSKRPFKDTVEMDEVLINNINNLVKPDDVLWFLGDFMFGPSDPTKFLDKAKEYLSRMHCKHINLIWGNHDPRPYHNKPKEFMKWMGFAQLFESNSTLADIKVEGQRITLCHYAMQLWYKMDDYSWHLYGHSHGSLPDNPNSLSFDVGVDCHNYKPLSFYEVKAIMNRKSFIPVDHHGKES